MRTFSLYIMPLMGGGILFIYPALMQVAFSFAAILGLVQSSIFRQPWIRAKLGIQPLPLPPKTPQSEMTPYRETLGTHESPTSRGVLDNEAAKRAPKGMISSIKSKAKDLILTPVVGMKKGIQQHQATAGIAKKKHGRTTRELQEAQRYEERRQRQHAENQQSRKKGVR